MKITIILISIFLHSAHSACADYIYMLEGFTCEREEPFYENSGAEYFKVRGSLGTQVMRVNDVSDSTTADHLGHSLLLNVEGVLSYDVTVNFGQNEKIIDLFEDCIETLTLEATLLKHKNYFGDEKSALIFFVKVLKIIEKIHDEGMVLTNLTMDSIFISEHGAPLIHDVSWYIEKDASDSVSVELTEYTSVELYRDTLENQHHEFSGWEDYFPVGVMLYYTLNNEFPFDVLKIKTAEQFNDYSVKYEDNVSFMTQELVRSLISVYKGEYQMEDIGQFVDSFGEIEEVYFNIPAEQKTCHFGIFDYQSGTLRSNFVEKEIESDPKLEEYFENPNAEKFKGFHLIKDNGLENVSLLSSATQHVSHLVVLYSFVLGLLAFL